MATRRFKISVGEAENAVTEEAGAAVNSDTVELTVECAATAVNATSGQRQVAKLEVIEAIEKIKAHIMKANWPPV